MCDVHLRAAGEHWLNRVDQKSAACSWAGGAKSFKQHQRDDGLTKPHHQMFMHVGNTFFSNPANVLPLHCFNNILIEKAFDW